MFKSFYLAITHTLNFCTNSHISTTVIYTYTLFDGLTYNTYGLSTKLVR